MPKNAFDNVINKGEKQAHQQQCEQHIKKDEN